MVPELRVVHYWRSNIVKHAISFVHAKQVKKNCGVYVVNADTLNKGCKLQKKIHVKVMDFETNLKLVVQYDRFALSTLKKLVGNLRRKMWYTVKYEELLGDESKVIQDLLNWVMDDNHTFIHSSNILPSKCIVNCTKITSDNLRNFVDNFEEIENWLETHHSCLLPQLYEQNANIVQPAVHSPCVTFNSPDTMGRYIKMKHMLNRIQNKV